MNSADRRSGKACWHADSGGFSQPDPAREAHSGHSCYYWHNSCHLCNTLILFSQSSLYVVIIPPYLSIILSACAPHPQLSLVLTDYGLWTAIPIHFHLHFFLTFFKFDMIPVSFFQWNRPVSLSALRAEASFWQVWWCYPSSLICVLAWSEQSTDNFYLWYKGQGCEAVGPGPDWIKREINTLCMTTKGSDSATMLCVRVCSLCLGFETDCFKKRGNVKPIRFESP